MSTKFAFIDRDGTLIHEPTPEETRSGDIPYQIDNLKKLKILPNVVEGLQRLIKKNYKLVMISNQDGVGTNIFPQTSFDEVQNKLIEILKDNGIIFEKIFICTHMPDKNCKCRKPKTALLDNLLKEEKINIEKSLFIGDRDSDKEMAKNICIKFIEIKTNGAFKIDI